MPSLVLWVSRLTSLPLIEHFFTTGLEHTPRAITPWVLCQKLIPPAKSNPSTNTQPSSDVSDLQGSNKLHERITISRELYEVN
jgi:hypothetical protein